MGKGFKGHRNWLKVASKYDGFCHECQRRFPVGEVIWIRFHPKRVVHVGCTTKEDVAEINLSETQGQASSSSRRHSNG